MKRCTFSLITAIIVPALAQAAAKPETGVRLTIYNDNFALVKDQRMLDEPLKKGINVIRFRDVASTIDATSVYFRSLTDPEASVVEQNYEFDLVNADKLLTKYIDKPITVFTGGAASGATAGEGQTYEGTLMSFDGRQLVLAKDKEKGPIFMVERGENIKRIQFSSLPQGLLTKPTLVWELATGKEGKQSVEVSYIANNIRWRADYNLVLNPEDTKINMSGWVTIENNTGTGYKDAAVKLLAGEPKIDYRSFNFGYGQEYYKIMMTKLAPTAEQGKDVSRAFGEYRMYTLPEPTTVNNSQIKQIELINAADVPVTKTYLYDGAKIQWQWGGWYNDPNFGREENKKVNVLIEFENRADRNLGIALPKGKCRVYKKDTDGSLEFIGEDTIDSTPRDERVVLYIGDAFDIVGERKQTDFRILSPDLFEEAFEIKVRNHKKEAVKVKILEKLYRWAEWEILKKSTDYEKLNSRTIIFPVEIKPDGEAVVTYRVRYHHP
jgi:hypothetical protein